MGDNRHSFGTMQLVYDYKHHKIESILKYGKFAVININDVMFIIAYFPYFIAGSISLHMEPNCKHNILQICGRYSPKFYTHIQYAISTTSIILVKPEMKYVGNMHGNEPIGRELLIRLADYLCEGWKAKDQEIVDLLNRTNIHLMPTMNPDGFEQAYETVCYKLR